ncbi:hypothetical protein BJX70DRAFT_146808 [Aspergillus crustosus]
MEVASSGENSAFIHSVSEVFAPKWLSSKDIKALLTLPPPRSLSLFLPHLSLLLNFSTAMAPGPRCNICACPLSSSFLRSALIAEAWGEVDLSLCWDDSCICDEDWLEGYGGELHDDDCPSNLGYSSKTLSQSDIAWLDRVRMIRIRYGNHGACVTSN